MDYRELVEYVVGKSSILARTLAERGVWDGVRPEGAYYESCRQYEPVTGTVLIYTRENGYHTGGWWKNPAYERCYHLSISFRDPKTRQPRDFDVPLAELWCREILRDMIRFTWFESPKTPEGRALDVRHWRVFCDLAWKPIVPPGEVYSRGDTPAGYRTTSERHERD